MRNTRLVSLPLAALVAALAAGSVVAVAQARPAAPPTTTSAAAVEVTGAARTALLTRASAALEAVRTAQGRFVQTNPDRSTTRGEFWLQRPGKMRFQYAAPSPLLVVADGTNVAIQDSRLKTTDRTPLRTTPLHFFLKAGLNLERDARITAVRQVGGTTQIVARDRAGEIDGEVTLILSGANLQLTGWRVVDGQRGVTVVSLEGVTQGARIDPAKFILRDIADPTRTR
jgi:outer membrane lipoprotein-sorting protein